MAMKEQKDVWHHQRGDVTRGHNVEQDVKVTFEARLWSRRNPKLDVRMIVEFQILHIVNFFFNIVKYSPYQMKSLSELRSACSRKISTILLSEIS